MQEVSINEKYFLNACKEWFREPVYNNSYTNGNGTLAGILGERVVAESLGLKRKSTKDYDLITPLKKLKIEVKTKRTSVKPLPDYLCSIFKSSEHQQWQRVYFTRVTYRHNKIYLLGWLSHKDFYKLAMFTRKGEILDGNKRAIADCYSVKIKDLKTRWVKC